MSRRLTLKDLPEQEMAKVKELVERFTEEKNQKEKYKSLYQNVKTQYDELRKKYEQLDKNHAFMKAQLSNSKIAIIKAKEAYNANKSAQKRRVSEEHEEQEQWENVREETEVRNRNLFETEYKVNPNRYMFEDSENKPKNINLSQTARPKEKPPLNFNSTGSKKRDSSKKKEIVNLRKQIEELTQEMKNKQRSQLPLTQKMRQCEQIKRRYKNKDKNESEEERQVIETPYKNIQTSSKTINRTSSKQIVKSQLQEMKKSVQMRKQIHYNNTNNNHNNGSSSKELISTRRKEKQRKEQKKTTQEYDQSFFDIIQQLNHQ